MEYRILKPGEKILPGDEWELIDKNGGDKSEWVGTDFAGRVVQKDCDFRYRREINTK